jgi:uncharacterized damage-inducible protein DinB
MNADQLFGHWDSVRQGLLQALGQLMDEQLQFTPRPELRTIGAVACHIASAEDGWFRYVGTRHLTGLPILASQSTPRSLHSKTFWAAFTAGPRRTWPRSLQIRRHPRRWIRP